MLIPKKSLRILFGSQPLRCRDNEILKVIMMMTRVVMVMIGDDVNGDGDGEEKIPQLYMYHNSRSTAPWRR